MRRPRRAAEGGVVYHALNRANARLPIFEKQGDYEAFECVLEEAVERYKTRLLAYCLMPNHWHVVLWPREDGELSRFLGWLTLTHTQRWHAHRDSTGSGHLYQGRFKSFPVQEDDHFYRVCRYVERNALRARLVKRAEDWQWGSLWRGCGGRRRRSRCWPPGRCHVAPVGRTTSTNRRRKANLPPCAALFPVAPRTATTHGQTA